MQEQKKVNKGLVAAMIGIIVLGILIAILCASCALRSGNGQGANVSGTSSDMGETGNGVPDETDENGNGLSNPATGGEPVVAEGLSELATEYEGRVGTGDFNYGEALQKSLIFYELQRSGDLSGSVLRTNWRGNSGMTDGSDVGLDLTGGLYDAGDNMKFNLPMAYTSAMLAWSVYEYRGAYEESGQLEYALDTVKWVNDYLIKCHPEDDVYYYQIGDGGADHSWWGACEVMQMERPSYKVTVDSPGSAVVAEAAASLASCALIFKDTDAEYAALCLSHAEQLYDFAYRTKSDAGYTAANGFYDSWSGFYDELAWAGCWLYLATGDAGYLDKAEESMAAITYNPKWTQCWDDVSTGALLLLCGLTGDESYAALLEQNLDYWTVGMSDGSRITYTPQGLAWLDSWGSLRYATTESYIALVYADSTLCADEKAEIYRDFAVSQVNYALGSTGRSFVVGFGEDYPQYIHHRTAHGSYTNNINEPAETRHTLYGALVGGPDANDYYEDSRSNYTCGEVACDYNAGYTAALAALYEIYGGQTLVNFGAVEQIDEAELFVEAGVNVYGDDFVEIKAYVYNETAWPARVTSDLELRYFLDLSELYAAGGSAANVTVTTNYMQGGTALAPQIWDEENHIYYVAVDFSGVDIYPGGQECYRKEVQVRIRNEGADGCWDNTNDPSFAGLDGTNGSVVLAEGIALYEGGRLVWGTEPDGEAGGPVTEKPSDSGSESQSTSGSLQTSGSAVSDGLTLYVEHTTTGASANSISMNLNLSNQGSETLKLSELEIKYYFTEDGAGSDWTFSCYNAAVSAPGSYEAITEQVKGVYTDFAAADGVNADKVCTISFAGNAVLAPGSELVLNVSINRTDWSTFNLSNDYSGETAEQVVVVYQNKVLMGEEPDGR